jgi:hypothetical protein
MFQSQRAGIGIVAVVFFFVGALLLLQVNEAEGVARAGRSVATDIS